MTDAWGDLVWAAISNLNARLALVMPGILAMLTLAAVGLAGGWITARIVRRLARKIFGAAGILLVGWLVANFLGEGALIAAVNARVPEARLLARAVRWGVLLFAAAMAVTHLGIGKEIVLLAFGITFGGLVLTLSLAFGLGGRALARQILDRYRRRDPHPSETLTHL